MTDKILNFTGQTTAEVDIPKMAENIIWEKFQDVIILAFDKEDQFRAYASNSDAALLTYMIEKFKINLLTGVYDQ